jgi:pimeloyl-ACP methyl ester carboxylesterase
MSTIYKKADSKAKVLALYDRQMKKLNYPYKDLYVETPYGETHLVETGDLSGKPLLVFHGGNSTSAYNLLACSYLLKDFHIYAVDTIGHPGKSAEVSLSSRNYEYGIWASAVIDALGYEKMVCFGASFGAGILAKTMCVSPQKVETAALLVPSGIKNAPAYKSMSMMFPMIMYWITGNEKWLIKCILPMAISEDTIDEETFETVKNSIDNVKIKAGMPSDVKPADIQKCKAPTLVLAADNDCLFPAGLVIPQAKSIIPNCTTYLLEGRGHINYLTIDEQEMIVEHLRKDHTKIPNFGR